MAAYFRLYQDGKAVDLQKVDELMCKHFDVAFSDVQWCGYWYDSIGFLLVQ